MTEPTGNDRPSPFAGEDWLDPLEERVRQSIRSELVPVARTVWRLG